jgi:hypothetical protein
MHPECLSLESYSDTRGFYLHYHFVTYFLLVFLQIALTAVFKHDVPVPLEPELVEAFDDIRMVELIH